MKLFLAGLFNYIYTIIMWMPCYILRRFLLKRTLGTLGKSSFIMRNVDLRKPKNVFIGNNVIINKKVLLDGRGGKLIIGDNVDIAQEVNIWTLTHDINDDNHKAIGFDVTIDDYVWIGSRVAIMPGVKIGKGAVVGTCSVVTKNVPENTIVAGIPAKIIGYRNNKLKYTLNINRWFR